MLKRVTFWLDDSRAWLVSHKETASTIFIVLATICLALNTSALAQKNDLETELIFLVSNVGVSYGSYDANTTELVLDRSIQSECEAIPSNNVVDDSCNSNKTQLEEAISQRDGLKANNAGWVSTTTAAFQQFAVRARKLNHQIELTQGLGLGLLILAIITNTL